MKKRTLLIAATLCAALFALCARVEVARADDASAYYIEVDITNQITTVYKSGDGTIVRQMLCSTGTGEKTPRGTFRMEKSRTSTDRQPWYYIVNYRCYVKYASRIKGSILFHSIPYSDKSLSSIDREALSQLGNKASHGCIRLDWQDAYWIACNCPDGTTVKIYNGAARKPALRELLSRGSFTVARGLDYDEFLAASFPGRSFSALKRGETGDEVAALQQRLIRLGLLGGEATGRFDGSTAAALLRYQVGTHLPVSGVADRAARTGIGLE